MEDLTPTVANSVRNPLFSAAAVSGVVGLALAGETMRSIRSSRQLSTEAPLVVNHNDQNHDLIVIGGCRSDATVLDRVMEPAYGAVANTAYISYPSRGDIVGGVQTALLRAREELGRQRPLSILAVSMGALVLSEAVTDPMFRRELGRVDTLIADSSPSNARTVRRGVRTSLIAASLPIVRDSDMYNDIARVGVSAFNSLRPGERGDGLSEEVSRLWLESSARVRCASIYEQGKVIRRGNPAHLRGLADNTAYVYAPKDGVVRVEQASQDYATAVPETAIIIDDLRPAHSHAGSVTFPQRTIQLLTKARA